MAPIRRYLRITKYSVLEVRIYLDKPSDAPWLLSSKDNVLARIFAEIRPKVLPKLREENENAKRKASKKSRGIKDIASQDDFEVTIFLTETSTRHSLLTKNKRFSEKPRIQSKSSKLTSWVNTSANPIHVGDDETAPEILREDDDADDVKMDEIPEAQPEQRDLDDSLFVSSSDEETFLTQRERPTRSSRRHHRSGEQNPQEVAEPGGNTSEEENGVDDKKKLTLKTTFDGFSIYGRILCLVVKRKGQPGKSAEQTSGGREMMEKWVSTQAAQETGLFDDD